jgi:alkanesulfonate monooxygenase SsuD/methylene tetrahydromethanopterin reductase-like flavin-dependent oxidoreductase (luciferase family)
MTEENQSMSILDVGVVLPTMGGSGKLAGDIAATARHAEGLGTESVWVIDQLVAGTGVPILDSTVALAVAAAVTTRIQLGFGVIVLPLRPVAWVAKQVASLQVVSDDRIILGVGAGGDRHELSWAAAGVPRRERGKRTDAALRVLPGLISGEPTRLDDKPDSPVIQLAPAATVPPILVGGMSDAAMTRAVEHGDGWFLLAVPPAAVADGRARLAERAAVRGRPTPPITVSMLTALSGDPALPDRDSLIRMLTDVDGSYAIPADQISDALVSGGPSEVAARLADYAESGARRVVASFVGGDWHRQVELLAEAHALLG